MTEESSRPPTLADLTSLCRELNARGAKYIVVGGMAMIQHGFVRATEDIDLLVGLGRENEARVIEGLATLPDHAALELSPGDVESYEVIRVADEIVVDLMKSACGVSFEAAQSQIMIVELEGVKVPFASLKLMRALKQGLRPKDAMDLEFIESKLK